ncbi:MAG: DUF1071 domain-containing protein [Lactobacillus sp.]|nr:DUF1071 domain-containing protein [Lactobacillus sp.]
METQNDKKSVYEVLSNINVKPKLEKKGQIDYLSWANAWGMVKQAYPDANYKITEFPEFIQTKNGWEPTGRDVDYRQTSAGVEVEAVVTIKGESYSSKLFVMDYRNKPVFNPNYFDINKTQQRALVKALAIAGLGLNVYAGEDLPNFVDGKPKFKEKAPRKGKTQAKTNNLKDYTVNYNGQLVPMYLVVKHASEGNQKARDFANSLKGKDLEIFTSLAKNGVVS